MFDKKNLFVLFSFVLMLFMIHYVPAYAAEVYGDDTNTPEDIQYTDEKLLDMDGAWLFPMESEESEIEKHLSSEDVFYEKIVDTVEDHQFIWLSLPDIDGDPVKEDIHVFFDGILEMSMYIIDYTNIDYDEIVEIASDTYNDALVKCEDEEYGRCFLWRDARGNLLLVSEYFGVILVNDNSFIVDSGLDYMMLNCYNIKLSDYR